MDDVPGTRQTSCYASALSEHPDPAHAAADVTAVVGEQIGRSPELAALFVTPPHRDALAEIAGTVRDALQPGALLGAAAVAVIGPGREVEQMPGVSLFAARSGSMIRAVHLRAESGGEGWEIAGLPEDLGGVGSMILVPDPFTFPVHPLLAALRTDRPGLAVIGGLASAADGPGGNRLVIDDDVHADGAVGLLLGDDVSPGAVVSQGCRPIGQPYIVTRADGNLIYELGGRPALERLLTMIERLSPEDRTLAEQGLHCGIVIDEAKDEFRRGDFLIRGVLGADAAAGAVAVGDAVAVGSTVQFQVRDAASADEDLRELLTGRRARGALVFTCNGRGRHMFGTADHDATVIGEALGTSTVAGMFCAGELGPVGGRNALHGFTASVALFP